MSNSKLGRVESLFSHVKSNWWKDDNGELYLQTNGDVTEDPAITAAECVTILNVPGVSRLFEGARKIPTNPVGQTTGSVRVLDLCCGQGRHSIKLAKDYPCVEFHGHDQCDFLIDVAKERAKAEVCENIFFTVGDALSVPASNASFDFVMVMGNSFGWYTRESGNLDFIKEVTRVLKPGGILLIDQVNADWTRASFSPGGWEWVNGGAIDASTTKGSKPEKRLIACRERELSSDGKWLASRELVIDLEHGICQELFYQVRLYGLDEMDEMLTHCQLTMQHEDMKKLEAPTTERNEDLGMMASRHLIVAKKCNQSHVASPDLFYVHPSLAIATDIIKGKLIRPTTAIPAGTLLIIGEPYALVPSSKDSFTCSRLECSRKVHTLAVECPNACVPDVVWCNDECKNLDADRHEFECSWLKQNSENLRREDGEYDFTMLWLIVRTLGRHHLEGNYSASDPAIESDPRPEFACNWASIWDLASNRSIVPSEKLNHWTYLISNYLITSSLPETLNPTDLLNLICKEEMNSFGLYPHITGLHSPRKEEFAVALYPTASYLNHSCIPNV
jgi:SAM-dependent methyltransferase